MSPVRARRSRFKVAMTGVVVGVVVGLVVTWSVLLAMGWRVFVMTTPSMSPGIPVHALVVTAPTARLHVGQVAAFRPPGSSQIFVHKIVAVERGGYKTKGTLNSTPDPWTVPPGDVLGKEVWAAPVLGLVLWAIPVWICILLGAWGLSRLLDRRHRRAIAAFSTALCIEAPLAIWRPLVGMDIVSLIGQGRVARAYAVGTGVLPERLRLGSGPSVVVAPGHAAVLSSSMLHDLGIAYQAALPWWGWAIMAAASCLPLLVLVPTRAGRRPLEGLRECDHGP
ncbi:MAG: S26 family signal peptidase, partial [Acidimicrobiales bacterium]